MSPKSPRDLELAREFLEELSARLDLNPALIEQSMPHLLGMTKHVAHGVVRPAAPLAAFLVGYAAALGEAGQTQEKQPEAGEALNRIRGALEQVEVLIKDYQESSRGQA